MIFQSRQKPQWKGIKEIEAEEKRAANRFSLRTKRYLRKTWQRLLRPYLRLSKVLQILIAIAIGVAILIIKAIIVTAIKVAISLMILALFPVLVFGAAVRMFGLHKVYRPKTSSFQEESNQYMEEMADQNQWEEENHWN